MEDKIEVNEYVRTKDGRIRKLQKKFWRNKNNTNRRKLYG